VCFRRADDELPKNIDFEAEHEQFGRNTASRSTATFLGLLAARTSDERFVAAAWRGRRAALEAEEVGA
jgi:hypothetical protein